MPFQLRSSETILRSRPFFSSVRTSLKASRKCRDSRASRSQALKTTMTTLVSFDVDGTLITATSQKANFLHKMAFAHGLRKCFDLDTNVDVIKHHGMTDPLILLGVLEHHGISKDKGMSRIKEMEDVMVTYYREHLDEAGVGLEILPGVKDLLEALKGRGDVMTCLVTGNLTYIGWAKMEALGIKQLFSEPYFGGFGSDFCSGNLTDTWKDRAELVRIAAKKAGEIQPGSFKAKFHVGDTPMDVLAADGGNATAVGVLTGIYTKDELEKTGVDAIILENLEDTPAVLKAMGLS